MRRVDIVVLAGVVLLIGFALYAIVEGSDYDRKPVSPALLLDRALSAADRADSFSEIETHDAAPAGDDVADKADADLEPIPEPETPAAPEPETPAAPEAVPEPPSEPIPAGALPVEPEDEFVF